MPTALADPNAPDGYDLGYYSGLGDVTTKTLSDMPFDGIPFYVTVYWFDGSWYWNRWQITITPAPDRREIARSDVNTGAPLNPPCGLNRQLTICAWKRAAAIGEKQGDGCMWRKVMPD